VSFYELNGYDENPNDRDPFNIYNDPSWLPLIQLTADKTDRIVMRPVRKLIKEGNDPLARFKTVKKWNEKEFRFTETTIRAGDSVLTEVKKVSRNVNTVWKIKHFLENLNDVKAYLNLPIPDFDGDVQSQEIFEVEKDLGDTGIVMLDTPDPICLAAGVCNIEMFYQLSITEKEIFHSLLDRFADLLYPRVRAISEALPGRLWRIYGPEYGAEPFLPPNLFEEYVVNYDKPMVEAIESSRGFARIHSHGRLRGILDQIVSMGCSGLDPVEPPPQGDVQLEYVRKNYGEKLVLFGNLELSDIVNCPTEVFSEKVHSALREGTAGNGRGFVLMPSACPYGRKLPEQAILNYEKIIEIIESI
jgi:hypothetical protein